MTEASTLFAAGGPLASALDGYEARPGQLQMALAVQAALKDDHVLLCEAGTGTGKTLAYLLPALTSGRRVVVSTATRALQDQLISKDVPLVERVLGRRVRVTVLKGLANYLCLRRTAEAHLHDDASLPGRALKLATIDDWRQHTAVGDLAELDSIAEDDMVLDLVRSSSDTRIGARCPHFEDCFVTKVKQAADEAELVITNHHLFFADLALRGPHPGRVLPAYDAVIFDEAHQLEDVATLFFGVRLSQRRIAALLTDFRKLQGAGPLFDDRAVVQVQRANEGLFEQLAKLTQTPEARTRLEPDAFSGPVFDAYLKLDTALEALQLSASLPTATPSDGHTHLRESLARRVNAIRQDLTTIVDGAPGRVTWIDNERSTPGLSTSAVDLSETLRERIFNSIPSVILTSATLTTSPTEVDCQPSPFGFIRKRLGAFECEPQVRELIVESPFDFRRNALLYVPRDLPAPNAPEFLERAVDELCELIAAARGGAFVLTTSVRSMRQLHASLKKRLADYELLHQGQAPKHALLERFRAQGSSVLVATMSFWEGVDVPGDALRLVALEKVPFSVPTDPVLAARAAALEEQGLRPFNELYLPLAQMMLKQGFGRLIRTQRDRGVVALLDSRIYKRGYGSRLLGQLPPARRTTDRAEACAFLRACPNGEGAPND